VTSDIPTTDSRAAAAISLVFQPIHKGNIFEETVERVLLAIKLGVISPGERLPSLSDLASALNVSRVTLREANRFLAQAGYLEVRRGNGGGTFVLKRPPSSSADGDPAQQGKLQAEEVEDAIGFRKILEIGTVGFAASRQHDDETAQMLRSFEQACSSSSVADYRPLDSRLHLAIAEVADVPSLVGPTAEARRRINDLLDAVPLIPQNIEHSNRQHAAMIDAILAGDVLTAVEVASEHVEATAALLRAFLV